MKTSKLLITSLLAAAAMSATAFAETSSATATVGNIYTWVGSNNNNAHDGGWSTTTISETGDVTYSNVTNQPGGSWQNNIHGAYNTLRFVASGTTISGDTVVSSTNKTPTVSFNHSSSESSIDLPGLKIGSLIVETGATGFSIVQSSTRYFGLGNGTDTFTGTINEDFSMTATGFLLKGAQNWTIASGKTMTFNGDVKFSGGTTSISGGGAMVFGSNTVTVASGATLSLSGAKVSLVNAIANSGTVNVDAATKFVLASLTGGTTSGNQTTYSLVNGGTLGSTWTSLDASNLDFAGSSHFQRGASATFASNGSMTVTDGTAGDLVWAGGENGAGTWNYSTTNTPWTNSGTATSFMNRDDVTFAGNATVTIDAGGVTANIVKISSGTVSFSGGTVTALGGVSVTGGTLNLSTNVFASGTAFNVSGGALTLGSAFALTAGTSIAVTDAGTVSGTIASMGAGSSLTLAGTGSASSVTISGAVGAKSGSGNSATVSNATINISGGNSVTYTNTRGQELRANIYVSGEGSIFTQDGNNGSDQLNYDGSSSGVISVSDGGTLALGSNRWTISGTYSTISLDGGNITGTSQTSGNAKYGNLDFNAAKTISVGNTYSKESNISASIRLRDNLTFNVIGDATLNITGKIANAANTNNADYSGKKIIKTGSGKMTLDIANSSTLPTENFTGGLDVNGGEVEVRHANALGSGAVTVDGTGSILDFAVSGGTFTQASGQALTTTNGGKITVSAGTLALTGAVNLSNAIEVASGAAVTASGVKFALSGLTGRANEDGSTTFTLFTLENGAALTWDSLNATNLNFTGTDFIARGASATFNSDGTMTFTDGTAGNLVWNGTSDNSTWNYTETNTNWTLDGNPAAFQNKDNVTFGADATVKTVTLENGADITVGNMTVESGDYTLNVGADNSATISGATLTVASGASLQVSSQLEEGQSSALTFGFDNISVAGTLAIYTNATDSWEKLTFADSGSGVLHLYDIGGSSTETGLTISTLQMSGNGAFTETYNGKVDVGVLTGSGNLTLNSPTDSLYNDFTLAVGDMTSYTGTVSLVKGEHGTLTLSVDSTKIGSGARIVVGADTTFAVLAGTNNSASGVNDLTNVTGSGKIEFAAAGHTVPGTGDDNNNTPAYNASFSWVKLSDQFTGTLSITSGVVDMLSQQGTNGNGNDWNSTAASSSAIDTSRLGAATLIELNGGGIQFRNANNTNSSASGYADVTFDKAISVGAAGGAIRLYGDGNVTLNSDISGAGTLSHTDGGTLTLAGTVNLTGGFTNAAGTTNFTGTTTLGTLTVSAGEVNLGGTATGTTTLAANAGTVNIGSGWALSSSAQIGGVVNIGDGGVWEVVGQDNKDSRIIGTVNINAGGTLRLAGHDALGYNTGGAMTNATIVAQGTEGNLAKIVIADTSSMTFGQKFQLKGYTEISSDPTVSGTNLNTFSGSVVATGTNNTISSTIKLRKAFTVEVTNLGDELLISGSLEDHNEGVKSLLKTGTGTLTLSHANTYTGGTTISAGTLVAAHASALGTLAAGKSVSVANGAKLQISTSNVNLGNAGAGVVLEQSAKLVIDYANLTETAESTATEKTFEIMTAAVFSIYGNTLSAGDVTSDMNGAWELLGGDSAWLDSAKWTLADNTLSLTLTIPEPSVFGLLAGLGALALAGTRRRRKA